MLGIRRYTTKVDISLVAKLRKQTQCSMKIAKDALIMNNNDYEKSLSHINSQNNTSKFASKLTQEGLMGVFNNHVACALVEVNAETDFVAKNSNFVGLVEKICQSLGLKAKAAGPDHIKSVDVAESLNLTCIGSEKTIKQEIDATILLLRENMLLKRALLVHCEKNIVGGVYAHSTLGLKGCGRLAAMVILQSDRDVTMDERVKISTFANKLAQHIIGFNPQSITGSEGLMDQQFLFGGGSVHDVLKSLGDQHNMKLQVLEFKRLEVGDGIKIEQDFASEVASQLKQTQ